LKEQGNITDSDYSTFASGKAGENSCIFQFGSTKYLDFNAETLVISVPTIIKKRLMKSIPFMKF